MYAKIVNPKITFFKPMKVLKLLGLHAIFFLIKNIEKSTILLITYKWNNYTEDKDGTE